MRGAFRSVVLFTLALGLLCPGCGGGSGGGSDFLGVTPGPFVFGVPLPVLGGTVDTLSLTNKSATDAVVFVKGYKASGAPYASGTTKFTIPARATSHFALPALLGESPFSGGFVYVDSRAADVLDASGFPTPVPTSGYVYPTMERRIGGVNPTADAFDGFAWRSTDVTASLTPHATAVHLYNASVDPMAGGAVHKAVTFELKEYDVAGATTVDTMVVVPAGGTYTHTPTTGYGHVSARPVSGAAIYRIGMRSCERDFYTSIEQRFKRDRDDQMPELREIGFEVDFGADFAGNTYDFGLLLNNPTADDKTVVLTGIYRGNGGMPMLTTPRFFTVDAHKTVFMATQTATSFGLDLGEVSFFDDLFGNVFTATDFEQVTLAMQIPREINASVRRIDPSFDSFYVIQQGILRTAVAAAPYFVWEPFVGTGNFNEVVMTNISTNDVTVPIRLNTPGGTEYILDSVVVPARSRFVWSPDGLQRREDPTDTVGPFVTHGCFRFSPSTGLFFRGRRREFNNVDSIILIRPQVIRDLQDDEIF